MNRRLFLGAAAGLILPAPAIARLPLMPVKPTRLAAMSPLLAAPYGVYSRTELFECHEKILRRIIAENFRIDYLELVRADRTTAATVRARVSPPVALPPQSRTE